MNAKSICVFAGSSLGFEPAFSQAARSLGTMLAMNGYSLIYGGARVGLMGAVADAALAGGGTVVGVIPQFLIVKEVAHPGLTRLIVTRSMHERKQIMAEMSDAFIALPGGLGTIDEFFEALTWAQLGIHAKPCGLLNVGGYYDALLCFLDVAVRRGLLSANNRSLLLTDSEAGSLVLRMGTHRSYIEPKWI